MAQITIGRSIRAYDTFEIDLEDLPENIIRALEDFDHGYEEEAAELIADHIDKLGIEAVSVEYSEADEPEYSLTIERV